MAFHYFLLDLVSLAVEIEWNTRMQYRQLVFVVVRYSMILQQLASSVFVVGYESTAARRLTSIEVSPTHYDFAINY